MEQLASWLQEVLGSSLEEHCLIVIPTKPGQKAT
jgi:hypothetical protein